MLPCYACLYPVGKENLRIPLGNYQRLTKSDSASNLANTLKIDRASFPRAETTYSDFEPADFFYGIIIEAIIKDLVQETVDAACGQAVEILNLGELKYVFSGRDSETNGKRIGSQTILLLPVEIKDIGTRNFIFVVDNHYLGDRDYTNTEYDNLEILNKCAPKLFVRVYKRQDIAVFRNTVPVYTSEDLGDRYHPFYLVGQRPAGKGYAFLYARDLESAYTEQYKGEIAPEAADEILVSLVARLTELQIKHGLIVKDMNFYEGDVMINPTLPTDHDEFIKITAARKLEEGTLYDLLTYLLFLRQDTRYFNGEKTEENAQVFSPQVVLQGIYKGLVNTKGEEEAKGLIESLLGEYLSKHWEYEEAIKGFAKNQSIAFKRGSIGYERILKVVNVGGQELTVIAEERINPDLIAPTEVIIPSEEERIEVRELADKELRSGTVGLITVGGGMSSRAGINYPKGETPITLLSKKTLYQCMAEELLAARIRYGRVVPWYIMTSEAMGNDEATRRYFKENNYFGLGQENVIFIRQESVGALESGTQEVAMKAQGERLTTPNGHGGIYKAMRDSKARTDGGKISALDDARARGVNTFLYTHVDNALPVINRTLLGLHFEKGADYTTTLVKKCDSEEGLAMAAIDEKTGRKFFVEYNQPAAAIVRDKKGFEYGSINRNVFSIDFFSAMEDPPFHIAVGKNAKIYKDGSVQDGQIDKFERFVFDNFGLARNAICVGLPREECFATFKEMTGPDSPEAVGRALSNYDKLIIDRALPGIVIPETMVIELPRIAHLLTPDELVKKLKLLDFESHLKDNARILVSDGFSTIYDVDIIEVEVKGIQDPLSEGIMPGSHSSYIAGVLKSMTGEQIYDELNTEFSSEGTDIAKVVYELAGNIYRHSSGGKITISRIFRQGIPSGILITSQSKGPYCIHFDDFMTYPGDLRDYYEGIDSAHQGLFIIMQYADGFSLEHSSEGDIIKVTKWSSASGLRGEKKIDLNIKLREEETTISYKDTLLRVVREVRVNISVLKLLSLDRGPIGMFVREILEEVTGANRDMLLELPVEPRHML